MILGVITKALRNVKAHIRHGRNVRPYTREQQAAPLTFKPFEGFKLPEKPQRVKRARKIKGHTKELFLRHYGDIKKWAAQSTFHQIAQGVHIEWPAGAMATAEQEALFALERYNPRRLSFVRYIRPIIKYAVLKYIFREERGHGLTGFKEIENRYHAAKTPEEKERILNELPKVSGFEGTEEAPSVETTLEHHRAILMRDDRLDAIEEAFKVSLKGAQKKLKEKEKERKTWKTVSLAKIKIRVFELRVLEGRSYRQIGKKLDLDPSLVVKYFQEMSRIHETLRDRGFLTKSVETRESRLAQCFRLLKTAVENHLPEDHIDFVRDVMADELARIAEKE